MEGPVLERFRREFARTVLAKILEFARTVLAKTVLAKSSCEEVLAKTKLIDFLKYIVLAPSYPEPIRPRSDGTRLCFYLKSCVVNSSICENSQHICNT